MSDRIYPPISTIPTKDIVHGRTGPNATYSAPTSSGSWKSQLSNCAASASPAPGHQAIPHLLSTKVTKNARDYTFAHAAKLPTRTSCKYNCVCVLTKHPSPSYDSGLLCDFTKGVYAKAPETPPVVTPPLSRSNRCKDDHALSFVFVLLGPAALNGERDGDFLRCAAILARGDLWRFPAQAAEAGRTCVA